MLPRAAAILSAVCRQRFGLRRVKSAAAVRRLQLGGSSVTPAGTQTSFAGSVQKSEPRF